MRYSRLCDAFNWIAAQAGKPVVILWVIFLCVTAFINLPIDPTNITISILSLVLSLMILGKQDREADEARSRDKAMHVKLDAIAHATDGVSEDVEGLEEKTEQEIDKVKRQL